MNSSDTRGFAYLGEPGKREPRRNFYKYHNRLATRLDFGLTPEQEDRAKSLHESLYVFDTAMGFRLHGPHASQSRRSNDDLLSLADLVAAQDQGKIAYMLDVHAKGLRRVQLTYSDEDIRKIMGGNQITFDRRSYRLDAGGVSA